MESIAAQVLAAPQQTQPIQTEENSGSIENYIASLSKEEKADDVGMTTEEVKKEEDPKLSYIMKKERQLQLEREAWKKEKAEFEEKFKRFSELSELEEKLKTNPYEALKKADWDIDKLNRWAVENLQDEELDPVAKKFKEFDSKIEKTKEELRKEYEDKLKAKEEELQKKEFENQISQFKSEIKSFLSGNKDEYEFINTEENGSEIVYDVIFQDLQNQLKSGKSNDELIPMDIKKAADLVEAYLDKNTERYINLKKIRNKFKVDDSMESLFDKSNTPKTITESFTPKSVSVDQLSEEERIKAATDLVKKGFKF